MNVSVDKCSGDDCICKELQKFDIAKAKVTSVVMSGESRG